MNYLFYDSKCLVCRISAFVVDKLFTRTLTVGTTSRNSHYWFDRIYPGAIMRLETEEVGLYVSSEDRFVYGEDAIRYMCIMSGRTFKFWNLLYKMANTLRNKCKHCKLDEKK